MPEVSGLDPLFCRAGRTSGNCLFLAGFWVYCWLPILLGDRTLWPRLFPIQSRRPEGSRQRPSALQDWTHQCMLPPPSQPPGAQLASCTAWRQGTMAQAVPDPEVEIRRLRPEASGLELLLILDSFPCLCARVLVNSMDK